MKAKKENIQPEIENFEARYQELNTAQKAAVDTIEGPVVVIAGPGTGKTQVLTLRIANILRKGAAGVGPENILALTFTNAGVVAMQRRLASFVGPEIAYRVGIFTFHGFAEEQMKLWPESFKELSYGQPISDIERIQIIERLVVDGTFQYLKTFGSTSHYVKDILKAIGDLKREGIAPEDFEARIILQEKEILSSPDSYYKRKTKDFAVGDMKPTSLDPVKKNRELLDVYTSYQQVLADRYKYDFDDMILSLKSVLENDKNVRAELQERYQYILVDEHQDTNDGQNRILELLTEMPEGMSPNIFTVGDDKQAIYRFQGASVENFLRFEKRFPDTVVIHLDKNYRSAQKILDTAHTLITSEQGDRQHVILDAQKKNEGEVSINIFPDRESELNFVVTDIETKLSHGVAAEEIAVMYRDRNTLPALKKALDTTGIAYRVTSQENLLQDPVIRKLFLYLKAVAEPLNDRLLGEALLIDFLDVEILDVLTLFRHRQYQAPGSESLLHMLARADKMPHLPLRAPEKLVAVARFIEAAKKEGENTPFLEFFDWFIRHSGFLKHVLSRTQQALHLRQIEALIREVKKNVQANPVYRVRNFLAYVETLEDYEVTLAAGGGAHTPGIQLMTAHGSKGLEFEHVYVVEVVHGRFGHKKGMPEKFRLPIAKTSQTNLDDERRLLYVALTRAKESLIISYAQTDHEGKEKVGSVFLSELATSAVQTVEHAKNAGSLTDLFAVPKVNVPRITDLEFIQATFLATPLSVSALNNFFTSPLKYFFRNLVRIPGSQTKALLYGTLVHEALEKFFAACRKEEAILSETVLVREFEKALEKAYLLHEYREELSVKGPEDLRGFYQQYRENFSHNIETEKKIKNIPFVLEGGQEILLTGVIDKLEYLSDGTVCVVDYKTGRTWSEQTKEKKADLKRQLVFYKLLIDRSLEMQNQGIIMSRGRLEFVEKNRKTKKYECEEMIITKDDVRALEQEIQDFAKSVLDGSFLKADIVLNKDTKEYIALLEILQSEK